MIFYNAFYGVVFGISVMRIFTLLVLVRALAGIAKGSNIPTKKIPMLAVFVLYTIFVMIPPLGAYSSLFIVVDIICCFIIAFQLVDREESLKEFFRVYAIVCVCSTRS